MKLWWERLSFLILDCITKHSDSGGKFRIDFVFEYIVQINVLNDDQ